MKINPYTGQPLPTNQYAPLVLQPTEKITVPNLEELGIKPKSTGIENLDNPEAKMDIGKNTLNAAGDILNFGVQEYANFKNTSASTAESQAQMLGSTMKGASLGLKIGGPVGAGIGAVGGAALGFIDMQSDKNKRADAQDKEHREMLDSKKAERKESYYASKGEQVSNEANNIYGKQQKIYNPYG